MKAVIMAGGKGTRLRPLTLNTPKPMVPLLNRPCMEYIIELLKRYDIHQIAVTVQYLPEVIRNHFGDGSQYGVELYYAEEETPLGTAGSIKNAASFLDETFIVISGDALTDFNLRAAIAYHKEKEALATMVLTQVESPLEYGVVMTAEDGKVTRFLEKPSWSEVFSDTVNTGIYVLEPEILDWIPDDAPYDFSLNLFPELLKKNEPLYGYVADGYWSDIGNLQQYRKTQFDMLDGHVDVAIQATEIEPGIYVEPDVKLPSTLPLKAPAYIGSRCTLHPSSKLGPYTILGRGNTLLPSSKLERTIVWCGNYIGEGAELHEALLMDRTVVGSFAQLQEGAVIGSSCTIGSNASIKASVRLWPHKTVPAKGIVHTSMIWTDPTAKPLFQSKGVIGIPNLELHPERASRLAEAYGSTLPAASTVVISTSAHPYADLLKHACSTGLRTIGIHVLDLGHCSEEVTRHAVQYHSGAGAIHISLLEQSSNPMMLIQWMDDQGKPIAKSMERKLENAFYQEDYPRTHWNQIGSYRNYSHANEDYLSVLESHIDFAMIRKANLSYVLHLSTEQEQQLLMQWTKLIGGTGLLTQHTHEPDLNVLEIVHHTHADLGIFIEDSSQLSLITPSGHILNDDQMIALIMTSIASSHPNATLGVPSSLLGTIPSSLKDGTLQVRRTKESLRSIMEETSGLPFSPFAYRLYALSLILQYMAGAKIGLDTLAEMNPFGYTAKEEVMCSWHEKGAIMRELMTWVRSSGQEAELMDGIRIQTAEGSVLILPDQDEPIFQVFAQSDSSAQAKLLAHSYASQIVQSHQSLRK
ncbi:sugar phosphate nucleotidyltransferase [Paenibacillus sp. 1001270B_150601_E10]|uniref:sugar phosphate nucleotidyltransferase n=1 Tax=Paenibacillus sp. 1001270B_150601_E10 TaxID=2787079 RepID=UPI00189CF392|nr:sugar phosphate nucleotidyltransferase [Paenibacillus sp. 1001270B_150601_E10]